MCIFHSKQHSKLSFWDLRPLKTRFGIKTNFRDENQDESRNPYVAKFQKWPRMLCIDLLEGSRGLVSFANFLTPLGASRKVCVTISVFCVVVGIHFCCEWK